ncbi:MAG: hypothetical protein AB7O49_01000 [Sphingomonadales bacterium]
MRHLLCVLVVLTPTAAAGAPDGAWVCHYRNPDQKQQVRLTLAGGQLTVDRGIGAIPVKNAVVEDDRVRWKDGVTYEFFPKERRMTRTSATGTDDLMCIRA